MTDNNIGRKREANTPSPFKILDPPIFEYIVQLAVIFSDSHTVCMCQIKNYIIFLTESNIIKIVCGF